MNYKFIGLRISGTIFGIVALLHSYRLATGISVVIGDWMLPIWVNIIGLIATAFLAIWLWWLSKR